MPMPIAEPMERESLLRGPFDDEEELEKDWATKPRIRDIVPLRGRGACRTLGSGFVMVVVAIQLFL